MSTAYVHPPGAANDYPDEQAYSHTCPDCGLFYLGNKGRVVCLLCRVQQITEHKDVDQTK
jgi:hypothetical protein